MGDPLSYPHLTVNTRGVPCIDGTRHRVIDIVADHLAHAYSAAQIVEQYPDLTPAKSMLRSRTITIIRTK